MRHAIACIVPFVAILSISIPGSSQAAPARDAKNRGCDALPSAEMRIRLVLEDSVPEDLRDDIETTVTRLWQGEGLTFRWMPRTASDDSVRRVDLWLRIVARYLGSGDRTEPALGTVRFIGGLPHHDVLVSWPAVREWARRDRDRHLRTTFAGTHHLFGLDVGEFGRLARRAAGVAAAHEVGHFVLGMTTHDKTGLMRRDLLPDTTAALEQSDHALSAPSRRRLSERLARGVACGASNAASVGVR